jgi:hypothetical protein
LAMHDFLEQIVSQAGWLSHSVVWWWRNHSLGNDRFRFLYVILAVATVCFVSSECMPLVVAHIVYDLSSRRMHHSSRNY